MNKNIKQSVTKKIVSQAKPVKKNSLVKTNHTKKAEEIFIDWDSSCDCSSCPSKCC